MDRRPPKARNQHRPGQHQTPADLPRASLRGGLPRQSAEDLAVYLRWLMRFVTAHSGAVP